MPHPKKPVAAVPIEQMRMLDRAAIATILHRSITTVRPEQLPDGFPEGFLVGRRLVWLESEVVAWIKEQADSRPSMRRRTKPSEAPAAEVAPSA